MAAYQWQVRSQKLDDRTLSGNDTVPPWLKQNTFGCIRTAACQWQVRWQMSVNRALSRDDWIPTETDQKEHALYLRTFLQNLGVCDFRVQGNL